MYENLLNFNLLKKNTNCQEISIDEKAKDQLTNLMNKINRN